METFNYTYGLEQITIFASLAGILFFIIFSTRTLLLFHYKGWLLFGVPSVSLFTGLLFLLFPIANIGFQIPQISLVVAKELFLDGHFVLGVTAVLLGWKILCVSWRSFVLIFIHDRKKRNLDGNSSVRTELGFGGVHQIDWEESWKQLAQFGIFAISISTLFSLKFLFVDSEPSWLISVFAWVLFFFVDDWILISDYSIKLDVKPIFWHIVRMNVANGILSFGCIALLWITLPWQSFFAGVIPLCGCLYFLYLKGANHIAKILH